MKLEVRDWKTFKLIADFNFCHSDLLKHWWEIKNQLLCEYPNDMIIAEFRIYSLKDRINIVIRDIYYKLRGW